MLNKIDPFFSWVGSKKKLAESLAKHVPEGLNNYYEPFLGSGALFFQVKHLFKHCYLSDVNLDLITSYNAIKNDSSEVIKLLEMHHNKHSKEYYYKVRGTSSSNNPADISARFLYLNMYAFKGIYRLNKIGNLASSFSTKTYTTSKFLNRITECSSFLNNTLIFGGDFSFNNPQKDDFVYLDPPYHKSGEKFYTKLPFDESEQIRLRNFTQQLDKKKVKFMLSNSDTDFIRDLYKDFQLRTTDVKYNIKNQSKVSKEVIITNY